MPIGGASGIGWDENSPADSESAGLGDDRIRSLKSSVRQGIAAEHAWPSSGGDNVGYHLFGSARPYYGPQSQVSSSGSDGRLMLTSDTSCLFGTGSGGTTYLGGPFGISMGTTVGFTFPQRHVWVEEVGVSQATSNGVGLITFPDSGYSGSPFVYLTSLFSDINNRSDTIVLLNRIPTSTQATWIGVLTGGSGQSGAWVMWRSIGTRVL